MLAMIPEEIQAKIGPGVRKCGTVGKNFDK